MAEDLLPDPILQRAVSRVALRAERQENVGQLVATFVDPGISVQLENDNSQILYGRRGTGKTHVLKVLERSAQATEGYFALYIDMPRGEPPYPRRYHDAISSAGLIHELRSRSISSSDMHPPRGLQVFDKP